MISILYCGDALVRLSSARLAAKDVVAVRDSAALLDETLKRRNAMAEEVERAVREGYEFGREQALEEMRSSLAAALAAMETGAARESERRERSAAAAAMQAVERMLGTKEAPDIVIGLVREALRQSGAIGATVLVSPDMAEPVQAALPPECDVVVESDPALGSYACRIVTGEGQIVADLDTQLGELRKRWGLADGGAHVGA